MDIYKTVVKNPNGNKKFEIVDVWFASAYYIWQTGQAKTFPSGLKMKAFGSNPLSRVRSICDGAYTCERDDTDGCNGYGPSGQTQNGVLPTTGCGGKMILLIVSRIFFCLQHAYTRFLQRHVKLTPTCYQEKFTKHRDGRGTYIIC